MALGSALAAGMLYVVFGPDDGGGGGDARRRQQQRRRRRQRGYPPGMRNVGNYCFVNATLQVQPITLIWSAIWFNKIDFMNRMM